MPQKNVLGSQVSEGNNQTNNNLYEGPFEKVVSNDAYPNGFGIAKQATLKEFETIPGVNQSEQVKLRGRENARFSELQGKAFGNPTINNAGIVLDSFGGAFGEGGSKPDIQGGANK